MIIDYKKKFIFVGLPFSACSAISKELLEHYACETLLHKHSSIPVLMKVRPDIKIKDFEIIAVVRDPVETSLTLYHWLKDNRGAHFTTPENFVENGGTVTKRYRKLYEVIQRRNMSFEQYLDYCFKFIPYDSLLSENSKFLTKIIRYENLKDDFRSCFGEMGLKIDRDLPSYNKTDNKISHYNIDRFKLKKYFGPFFVFNLKIYKNSDCFKKVGTLSISKFDLLKFRIFRFLKSYYRLYLDMKFLNRKISHVD